MDRKRVPRRFTGISVKAIIFYKDKLLILQKIDREKTYPWEFPGGGLEYGEDFIAALHREVKEETDLTVEILGPIGVWNYRRSAYRHLTGMIFACRTRSNAVRLSSEHRDYRWVYPAELAEYDLHDSLQRSLKKMQAEKLFQAAELAAKLKG